jgi:ATP-binding cassette subfamily C (CFTR/MRP) protein 4
MLTQVARAPLSFFNTTPVGRIINRFSKDVDYADDRIITLFGEACNTGAISLGSFVVMTVINPWMLIPLTVICTLIYLVRPYLLPKTAEVKRLELLAYSPIFQTLTTTLDGIVSIRAYQL